MAKRASVTHEFVDFVPDELDDGVVYIALEHGAVIHLCCDGCGEVVSTPLHPAQWALTFDGQSISLWPSVGSSALACNSHYVIDQNRVRWYEPLTAQQAAEGRFRDRRAVDRHFMPEKSGELATKGAEVPEAVDTKPSLWRRLFGRK